MSLRSSAKDENGGISLRRVLPSTRHSRARGNPGWFSAELAWIPAFAGMTEPRRPLRSADYLRMGIFEGGTCLRVCTGRRSLQSSENFLIKNSLHRPPPRLGDAISEPCFTGKPEDP